MRHLGNRTATNEGRTCWTSHKRKTLCGKQEVPEQATSFGKEIDAPEMDQPSGTVFEVT